MAPCYGLAAAVCLVVDMLQCVGLERGQLDLRLLGELRARGGAGGGVGKTGVLVLAAQHAQWRRG